MAAVLASALLHAGWNALLKASPDKGIENAAMGVSRGLLALAVVPLLPLPAPAAWPWLIASVIVHIAYFWALANAYRWGDLSFTYPVMRGGAPALVAIAGVFVFGEVLPWAETTGVALISLGILAFDDIETPGGRADDVLGGSATHFAVAASFFAPVHLIAVVGEDFPQAERDYLASRGIDISGLETRPGKTFRWTGRYHEDLNVRDTLRLDLNVFAEFEPRVSAATRQLPFVYLGNIAPALQSSVLEQFAAP